MAKLSRAQRNELENIQRQLAQALAFIAKPDLALCKKGGFASTTMHMTRQADNAVLYEINKDIGSEFALAHAAQHNLNGFLERNK